MNKETKPLLVLSSTLIRAIKKNLGIDERRYWCGEWLIEN